MVHGTMVLERYQYHGGTITGTTEIGIGNESTGTIIVTSGNIIGKTYGMYGEATGGTITIGRESADLSIINPCVQGINNYGVYTVGTLNFYNGVIKSSKASDAGHALYYTGTINLRSGGYAIKTSLSNGIYSSILGYPSYTITLNNQSATTKGTTAIYEKYKVGIYLDSGETKKMTTSTNPITVPAKTGGYLFGGYYTKTNGSGTQVITKEGYITSSITNTYFTGNTTIYAYWINAVAKVNSTYYATLQAAFDVVPTTGTETTVYLLRDTEETTKVISGQNIILQLDGNTVSSSSGIAITNSGTLKIIEGTTTGGEVKSSASTAIYNNSTGNLVISGGTIEGTYGIQNNGGTVKVSRRNNNRNI